MEFSIELPLDDGFLRRECPACGRQFKWWEGDDDEDWGADLDVIFCPYCGETAGLDDWWTPDQLDYASDIVSGPAVDELMTQLQDDLKRAGGGLIDFKVQRQGTDEPPHALFEPSDMVAVVPPCHPQVPVKLIKGWDPPARCLACGSTFSY